MNFNLEQLNPAYTSHVPAIGNVYAAKGGKGTRFWVVVAMKKETSYLLGVNEEGKISSSQSYYTDVVGRMPLIGYCPDVDGMEFNVYPVPQ